MSIELITDMIQRNTRVRHGLSIPKRQPATLSSRRNRPKHPPCIRIGSRHPVLMVRGNITNYARRNPSSARILIPSADTHFESSLHISDVVGRSPARTTLASCTQLFSSLASFSEHLIHNRYYLLEPLDIGFAIAVRLVHGVCIMQPHVSGHRLTEV